MDAQQLDEISDEIKVLHKPMKNIIEVVFATSPLLALSTHGWGVRSFHGTYLLRVSFLLSFFKHLLTLNKIFQSLGNNRPQILVQLEDCVLRAIISILEGSSYEDALDTLYSQIVSLEKDLSRNDEALNWFNLCPTPISTPSTPPPSESSLTPLPRMKFNIFLII